MIELLNKVFNIDCLKGMQDIPDGSIDMILCDLPYGTTACKWDVIIPFSDLWEQYERVIKDNGAIVLFAAEPFSSALRMSNIQNYKYDWIWEKDKARGFLNAYKQPLRKTEDVCVFYSKQCLYNPQLIDKPKENIRPNTQSGKQAECYGSYNIGSGFRKIPLDKSLPIDILKFTNQQEYLHPTQKPVALFEYLIKTYTNEGEIVLDNCMGSGTTAIACINTGRNYIGFEKEEKYYNIIQKRIKNHVVQKEMFAA